MSKIQVLSDQPAARDRLNREQYSGALARIAEEAETPLVVGIYGDWGSGKSTLLDMIAVELVHSCRVVRFDSWQYQSDDNPSIALVQALVTQLELGSEGRKILSVIAAGVGAAVLKKVANISFEDILKLGERYEKERFQMVDIRSQLKGYFAELIRQASSDGKKRIVFLIDDLDRCRPDVALSVLEALQIYLSMPNCVYFVAADKRALESAVATRYGSDSLWNAQYLDKIIQLPFAIPPLHATALDAYVHSLLPRSLRLCRPILAAGLEGNPRRVKRFVNVLALNDELAKAVGIPDYDPRVLALLLLLQSYDPERYSLAALDPTTLQSLIDHPEQMKSTNVGRAFAVGPKLPGDIAPYIHLTEVTGTDDVSPEFMRPMVPSSALAAIIGDGPMSRTEVTKRLWAYIKKNGLQDERERRMINTDAQLEIVCNGKKQVSMFDLTKAVNKHLRDE